MIAIESGIRIDILENVEAFSSHSLITLWLLFYITSDDEFPPRLKNFEKCFFPRHSSGCFQEFYIPLTFQALT